MSSFLSMSFSVASAQFSNLERQLFIRNSGEHCWLDLYNSFIVSLIKSKSWPVNRTFLFNCSIKRCLRACSISKPLQLCFFTRVGTYYVGSSYYYHTLIRYLLVISPHQVLNPRVINKAAVNVILAKKRKKLNSRQFFN